MSMLSLGRVFFGVATLASGVLQLVAGEFVRIVRAVPGWGPTPSAWARLAGVVLVALGLAILSGRMARAAAAVLGAMIAVALVLALPQMIVNPVVDRPFFRGFMWTNPLKALALIGGAAILAGRLPGEERPWPALVRAFARLEKRAAVLLAVFLIVCGVQHFVYVDFVQTLVPSWIAGPRGWTYFTGVALVAGGTGILVPRAARLAGTLSAVMIFLWVLLLHIPRALAGPNHVGETAGVFEALAMSGVALMVVFQKAIGPVGSAAP
jgi:uncharacterized membrane protein